MVDSRGAGNAFLAQLISRDQLQQPDATVTQDQQVPITRAMRALYTALAGGPGTDKALEQAEGRGELVAWWSEQLLRGAVPRALLPTDATLGISDPTQPGNERDVVHPLAAAAYAQRSDLRDAFDTGTAEGRLALNLWLFNFGKYELRLHIEDEEPPTHEIRRPPHGGTTGKFLRGGVNIVGFGRGELGIGEDVRMASLALRHVDMDLCVPAIPLAIGARQQDLSLRAYEVDAPLYNTNLVFLPITRRSGCWRHRRKTVRRPLQHRLLAVGVAGLPPRHGAGAGTRRRNLVEYPFHRRGNARCHRQASACHADGSRVAAVEPCLHQGRVRPA